ncbi:helix-turn-helix domain-containing protein [Enterococcus avium]|uniref:helix-turn-helix domain-containing protein n=1 Tax=Enterococcus avium TaxID=33945 RepID=UPI00159DDD7A|nr:helix-turn-helix domain-containing protein [Enterococcus avium]
MNYNLFSKSETRQLRMLHTLYYSTEWITIKKLAFKINCSTTTIRDDIKFLNQEFKSSFHIETSNFGVRINFENHSGFFSIQKKFVKRSLSHSIIEYIFFNQNTSIPSISNYFDLSRATTYRIINDINTTLMENHKIHIQLTPMKIIGDEVDIRNFYIIFFNEKYDILEWPFQHISSKLAKEIMVLSSIAINVPETLVNINYFSLILAINLYRFQSGFNIELNNVKESLVDTYKNFLSSNEGQIVVRLLSDLTNNDFSLRTGLQIFYHFLQSPTVISESDWEIYINTNSEKSQVIGFLSNCIEQWETFLNTKLPNKNLFIMSIYNAAFFDIDEGLNYISIDKKSDFVHQMKKTSPVFFSMISLDLENFVKKFFKKNQTNMLHHMIFTVYTQWPNLFSNLINSRPKIKTLILNDYDQHYANFLKNRLNSIFLPYLDIEVLDFTNIDFNVNIHQLIETKFQLVISNFEIPSLKKIKCIYVDNILLPRDIHNIFLFIESYY